MKKLLIYSILSLQIISVIGCNTKWNKEKNIHYDNDVKINEDSNGKYREEFHEERDTVENKNFEKEKEFLNSKGNKYKKPDKKNDSNKPETLDKTENIPNKPSK